MASQNSHVAIEPFGVEANLASVNTLSEKDQQQLRELYSRDGLLLIRGLDHARGRITGGRRTLQRVTIARFSYEQQYPADGIWFNDLQEDRGFGARADVA